MKIEIKRLDHIQVCIPKGEEQKARDFYTKILSFEEIEKPEALKKNGGLWYRVGDIQLHIGTEHVENSKSKRHPAFEIGKLPETKQYLADHGVGIKEDTPIPGVERFSFFDPFENRIEFLEKNNGNQ